MAYADDYVNEELSDKWLQIKTPECLRAVDNDGNHGIGEVLLPLCENRSVFAEQAKPDLCLLSTIARPIIRGRKAGMMAVIVTEKGQVGGKVERMQVWTRPRYQRVVDADLVEAHDIHAVWQEMFDLSDRRL